MQWMNRRFEVMQPPAPAPKTAKARPAMPPRARSSRTTGSDSWTVDTRRGLSHYNQSAFATPLPPPPASPVAASRLAGHAATQPHVHTHLHRLGLPTFLHTPFMPIIGALPAVAANVRSIYRSHTRAICLTPVSAMLGQQLALMRRYLSQSAPQLLCGFTPDAQTAVKRLLEQHVDRLTLQQAALRRAIGEGSIKTACVCCELCTFMLVPLPAIHSLFHVAAGAKLLRPYTTLLIPAAFVLTAGLQIVHHAERLQEAFGLYQACRQAVKSSDAQSAESVGLAGLQDAALLLQLQRECLYTACQIFFWAAFACGMSAVSGSLFAGIVSPSIAIVCLLIGVAGTTLMHMGWADAYGVPDKIDDATAEEFNSLVQRRRAFAALSEEQAHIKSLRLACQAHLSGPKAWIYRHIPPLLEQGLQANRLVYWLLDWCLAGHAETLGVDITAHLRRLCATRLACQLATHKDVKAALVASKTAQAQACLQALPNDIRRLAKKELNILEEQSQTARQSCAALGCLQDELERVDAQKHWRDLAIGWLGDGHQSITERQLPHMLYSLFIGQPQKEVHYEKQFLRWSQRVGLAVLI